jgi:hypothetical protein
VAQAGIEADEAHPVRYPISRAIRSSAIS